VTSNNTNGTCRAEAIVLRRSVFPEPEGPLRRILDLRRGTPISLSGSFGAVEEVGCSVGEGVEVGMRDGSDSDSGVDDLIEFELLFSDSFNSTASKALLARSSVALTAAAALVLMILFDPDLNSGEY